MNKAWLLGMIGYPCLELLWRGRTHLSMALAGGMSCAAICRCAQGQGGLPRRALKGACAVTAIEYAVGRLFNRRHQIWDYRGLRGHIQGQICPQYFLAWCLLSGVVIGASGLWPGLARRPRRSARRLPWNHTR